MCRLALIRQRNERKVLTHTHRSRTLCAVLIVASHWLRCRSFVHFSRTSNGIHFRSCQNIVIFAFVGCAAHRMLFLCSFGCNIFIYSFHLGCAFCLAFAPSLSLLLLIRSLLYFPRRDGFFLVMYFIEMKGM